MVLGTMRDAVAAALLAISVLAPGVSACASTTLSYKQHRISPAMDFSMGAISGCTASFLVFPIDLAKTRIQDQRILAGIKPVYTSIMQTIRKVATEEGPKKLFQGVAPVLLMSAPESALQIGGNTIVRKAFGRKLGVHQRDIPLPYEIAAGCSGGFAQVLAATPMERLKVLQQIGKSSGNLFKTVADVGLGGLYAGWTACMFRDVLFGGIYFPVYSNAKTGINERLKGGKHEWSTPLLAGLLAGVPAATVSCPFDVIKTRMQATMGKTSMRTTAAELWVEGGAPAFFKGVGGRVGRVAPQLAIALFLYDSINAFVINALHVEPPKPEKKKKFGW